jgi:hypothetical protein
VIIEKLTFARWATMFTAKSWRCMASETRM